MLRSIRVVGLLVVAVTVSLPACGNDDPSAFHTAPFTSGLTKTETVGDLSDADVATLCFSLGTYLENDDFFIEARCRVPGFEAAAAASLDPHASEDALRKACSDAHDACIQAKPDPMAPACTKPNGTCTATVAELETCVADFVDAAKTAFLSIPPCPMLIRLSFEPPDPQNPPTELKQPASCRAVEAKCPGATTSTGLDSRSTGPASSS